MRDIYGKLAMERGDQAETILLICDDEAHSAAVLQRLYDAGLSAVGPVSTAKLALAMTAVTFPTVALVARPPTGRRNAMELAEALLRDWNVKSLLLCDYDGGKCDWTPSDSQVASLRDALGDLAPSAARA